MNVVAITTIHVPDVLKDLCENIIEHKQEAEIYVIGDKKTPPETQQFTEQTLMNYSVRGGYLGIEKQEELLPDKLLGFFPYNTPDRVILGCMLAYMNGADRVIALDDDNFPVKDDFIGSHSIAGEVKDMSVINSDNGWFNVCSTLKEKYDISFYPRGYPWGMRGKSSLFKLKSLKKKSIVNQGLILGDPDIDAIQRLNHPITATDRAFVKEQFGLEETWSPFNFQNTCLSREMIPLYYRPRCASRNSDIWTAYLYNRLAEHFGDVITFGAPLARQDRNNHNLWDDLELERINNQATDMFINILKGTKLTEDTYFKAMVELIQKVFKPFNLDNEGSLMILNFFREYEEWLEVVEEYL